MVTVNGGWLLLDRPFVNDGGFSDAMLQEALDDPSVVATDIARNMREARARDEVSVSASKGSHLFVRVSEMGSLSNRAQRKTELHWLGWNILTWHIRHFDPAGETPTAPVVAVCYDDVHREMAHCDRVGDCTVFMGVSAWVGSMLADWMRDHGIQPERPKSSRSTHKQPDDPAVTLAPVAANDPDPRHSAALDGEDVLFLARKPGNRVKAATTGIKMIELYSMTPGARFDFQKLAQDHHRNNRGRRSRVALIQTGTQPENGEGPVKTYDIQIDGQPVSVRQATYPTEIQESETGKGQLIYTTIWVYEAPTKAKRPAARGPKPPLASFLAYLGAKQ